jgi:hypothetical protein
MARVPRRTRGSPAIALTPEEAHLLSAVDGSLDERELSLVSGMPSGQVAEMLERLAMFGLVEMGEEEEAGRSAQLPPVAPEEHVDLEPHERLEITRLNQMLRRAHHYELLGVHREADAQEIKRAYYRLAPKFHPDRHFGKELGSYKPQIEAIFAALTRAHDTLRSTSRREAYDATLPPIKPHERRGWDDNPGSGPKSEGRISAPGPMSPGNTRQPVESVVPGSGRDSIGGRESPVSPRPTGHPRDSFASVRPPAAGAPRTPGNSPSTHPTTHPSTMRPRMQSTPEDMRQGNVLPPDAAEVRGPSIAPPPGRTQPPPRRIERRITQRTGPVEQAEREALARRLAGQKVVDAHRTGRQPAAEVRTSKREEGTFKPQTNVRPSATEALRERYDKLGDAAKQRRRDRYVEQGQAALDSGDYRTAVAAYEQALRLTPDDRELQQKLATAQKLAQ